MLENLNRTGAVIHSVSKSTWDFIVCLLPAAQGAGGVAGRDPRVSPGHALGTRQLHGWCVLQLQHGPLDPAKQISFHCCCI